MNEKKSPELDKNQKQFYEEIEKLKEKVNNYSKENLKLKIEFTKFEK